jgi:formate dehydrogenase
MPNSARLRRAFEALELLVVLDILPNETASLAHYVLPCTTPLERPDLPFAFPLLMGMQSRPYLQATEAVLEPAGESRDEASIYLDLARACDAPLFGSRAAQRALELLRSVHGWRRRREPGVPPGVPQELLLSAVLRATRQGSFRRLLREPHGRARPAHEPARFLGLSVSTEDGRVQLAPPVLVEQAAARLEPAFERERASRGRLKLITKRHVKTHNSWTHNDPEFVDGRSTNHLYIHPSDAGAAGLANGALADVRSETGVVRVPVQLDPDLQPGTVALPHGWGHQHAPGLSVASKTTGVNVNLLAADGPGALELVSGMAQLTGILVDVRPAEGPQDPGSWSGLPAA